MAPKRQTNNGQRTRRAPEPYRDIITHSLRRRSKSQGPDYSAVSPCVKYFLCLSNFLFLIAGLAFAVGGIYILAQKGKTVTSLIDFIFDPACLLCLGGLIIAVIAVFGFCGALREFTLFLKIYHYVLMIFLLLEIVVIIFVLVFHFVDGSLAKIGVYPEEALLKAVKNYRDDPDMQGFIDAIQETLSCCGASNDDDGYKSWNTNPYFNCTSTSPEACTVPFSCCKINVGENINYRCGVNKLTDGADVSDINTQGCLKGLQTFLRDNIWIVFGTAVAILIFQILFIFFGRALVSQIYEQMAKW